MQPYTLEENRVMSVETTTEVLEGRSYRTSILYWIGVLDKTINAEFVAEMGGFKNVVSRWRTLSILAENEGITISNLSNETMIERTALSRLLAVMETEKLLTRVPQADDRRIIQVYITQEGREMFERMLVVRRAVFKRATSGMDDSEREQLMRSIKLLVGNLGSR